MALNWRPVGPEPETTYWQRRAVVALAVLVPLVLLLSLLGGGDDDRLSAAPDATATPVPSATPTSAPLPSIGPGLMPAPSPSPTPTVVPCAPDAVTIAAAATEDSYAVGARPRLELRVSASGPQPCTADLGSGAVELLVFSGADRIWSSDDCGPRGGSEIKTLQPGTPDVSRVTWPGVRSAPGCTGDKAAAQPGTYRVAARVGERRVEGEPFVLKG